LPLVIVPTPVGNLADMTPRGIEALKSADAIACEDTRRALKLLNHYGIKRPLISYHRHNERSRADAILERLERGESVALVSDAGTPGISDPGGVLIGGAIERGIEIDALPGANAILPALLLSGLSAREFHFAGFVDEKGPEIAPALEKFRGVPVTMIFCVAPHDLEKFLAAAFGVFGDRRAAVVREISKVHQEAIRGKISELLSVCRERKLRGEMMALVEGAGEKKDERAPEDWERLASEMKRAGIWNKDIANVLFASYGIPRNRVKNFLSREALGGERN
jgi:16S rRNA (cytidine1402-2'-O)-methyltransferase